MSTTSTLQQATALLSSLQPSDVVGDEPEVVALREQGVRLFGRAAIQARYGEADVVGFLKEQAGHRRMLSRLEKLQKQITVDHEKRCAASRDAGINKLRQATLDAIEAAALPEPPEEVRSSEQHLLVPPTHAEQDSLPPPSARHDAGTECADVEAVASGPAASTLAALPPRGSFRRCCGVCKRPYEEVHHWYHALCPECAAFNYEKRLQSADMSGMVCIVTGGRVRIGYEICLKLLRAGARVIATSRYPADAVSRYASETDFDQWSSRLEVAGPLELANVRAVEAFCAALRSRFPRIHCLINNAAQTLTRAAGWHARMDQLESTAAGSLSASEHALVWAPSASTPSAALRLHGPPTNPSGCLAATEAGHACGVAGAADVSSLADAASTAGASGSGAAHPSAAVDRVPHASCTASSPTDDSMPHASDVATQHIAAAVSQAALSQALLADFPEGRLDETRQPLDLSPENSWSRRLGQVPTVELLHTLAANAVAPFVLCSALRPCLSPDPSSEDGRWGHIINVSALEGKFSVGKKSSGHPHTNMAKAALNMLTCTSAGGLFQERILVNAVDTGWVTDMAPGGVGAKAATHETHVGPPLDAIDGAARVLDPIFSHLRDPNWAVRGKFWKDYMVAQW